MQNYLTTTTSIPMEDRIKLLNDELIPYFGICTNSTNVNIISDPKKIYGYYQRTIVVENPITNVTVGNNQWLKHGDLCKLSLKYYGTSPFKYCMKVKQNDNSSLSVTAKSDDDEDEECVDNEWKTTTQKEIEFNHFFQKQSNSYTVMFHIKNEVSLVKTPIGIQFYIGKQLLYLYTLTTR